MAADPTAADRAYAEIKRGLFAGRFHLRQKLDALAIASELGISTTPVREALVRLASERLIGVRSARGYHVAFWTEQQLRDLFAWRGQLAELANAELGRTQPPSVAGEWDYAERIARLLQTLHAGGNLELLIAATSADDRLHAARRAEREIWRDAGEEVARLEAGLSSAEPTRRRAALRVFQQRRIKHASEIRERALLVALPNNGL